MVERKFLIKLPDVYHLSFIISVTCLYAYKDEVEGRPLWRKWANCRNQLMAGKERISGKAAINLSWVSINQNTGIASLVV